MMAESRFGFGFSSNFLRLGVSFEPLLLSPSIMPKFPEATVEPSIERLSLGKRHFRMAGLSRSTKYEFQEFSFSASLHREIIIPVSLVSLSGCHDGKHTIAKAHYGSKPK